MQLPQDRSSLTPKTELGARDSGLGTGRPSVGQKKHPVLEMNYAGITARVQTFREYSPSTTRPFVISHCATAAYGNSPGCSIDPQSEQLTGVQAPGPPTESGTIAISAFSLRTASGFAATNCDAKSQTSGESAKVLTPTLIGTTAALSAHPPAKRPTVAKPNSVMRLLGRRIK